MTTDIDICNRALSEIGTQFLITALDDSSPAASQCTLQYAALRQQLLRAAPWGFARKTLALTALGYLSDTPPASPYPWLVKYTYPADCLKMRYILPPPIPPLDPDVVPSVSSQPLFAPWCAPSREWRYLPGFDPGDPDADPPTEASKVILANVIGALGVYTADVEDPDLFDPLFTNALVMMLADKLVIPLSGNVGMKQAYVSLAKDAVMQARAVDGNEAIPSTNHVVDWMAARLAGGYPFNGGGLGGPELGQWYSGYDNIGWGM